MQTKSQFIADLLKHSNGRFVGVTFVKQDASIRNLNGRLGVKRYLKTDGTSSNRSTLDVKPSPVITIWDRQIKQYRSIHPDRILSLRINGVNVDLQSK